MALEKQNLEVPFGQGLDTKTDPFHVQPGKFLNLTNATFNKAGLLQKRVGFASTTKLSTTNNKGITTFRENLVVTGEAINLFSQDTLQWVNKGPYQNIDVDAVSVVRNANNQVTADCVVAPEGLAMVVWTDGTSNLSFFKVVDSVTGQTVRNETQLPTTARLPKVFLVGPYFLIAYVDTTSGNYVYRALLWYDIAGAVVTGTLYTGANTTNVAHDAFTWGNRLYFAVKGSGLIRLAYIDAFLNVSTVNANPAVSLGATSHITVTVDPENADVWLAYWNSTNAQVQATCYTADLVAILPFSLVATQANNYNISIIAFARLLTVFYDEAHPYTFDTDRVTWTIYKASITETGTVTAGVQILLSCAIWSRPFRVGGRIYLGANYYWIDNDPIQTIINTQPTYFIIDEGGKVFAKIAQPNGGDIMTGYLATATVDLNLVENNTYAVINPISGNPFVKPPNTTVQIPFLIQFQLFQIGALTKGAVISNFGQQGVNLATLGFDKGAPIFAEIAQGLHISGGYLWHYDGTSVVEHGFHLYPEPIGADGQTGGSMSAQTYTYYAVYEWTDAQGNIHQSAPSAARNITLITSTSVQVHVPCLRVTAKTATIGNPVKITIYRSSVAQPIPYEVTNVKTPTLNNPQTDYINFNDNKSDAQLVGKRILYTFGGIIENIAAPAVSTSAIFKSRLFVVNSEDPNEIWFSKQVIEAVPVEFSDLLTLYVAPTVTSQSSPGPIVAIASLDDKLIVLKKNALYYITGTGPDNTGQNNDFSDPTFIQSTIGCTNKHSVVTTPHGLMFQSDKGIWQLGRDLQCSYIGAPVERFNASLVTSALAIPGTNQVRFSLDTGEKLVYDYYFDQWAVFTGITASASTVFAGVHTYLSNDGQTVLQQRPGFYRDGATPVVMSFETGWFKMAGLQGFQRAYWFILLARYHSPHQLYFDVAYDYNDAPQQRTLFDTSPGYPAAYYPEPNQSALNENFSNPNYGDSPYYGGPSPYGGTGTLEQVQVFFSQQKCQSFKITMQEFFDPLVGTQPGPGLSVSGLNIVFAAKGVSAKLKASQGIG
jgi:hypothetical protein